MQTLCHSLTHPGDGQGLVEVLSSCQTKAPGGRPIQHHVKWHDPLKSPCCFDSSTDSKLHTVGITVKEQWNIKVMEILNQVRGSGGGGWIAPAP